MKKKVISVLLALAMVLGCTACGGSSDDDSSNGSSEGKTTIKVFSNLPDRTTGQGLIEQMLFDQYMEENENVVIEVEALDDESYKTKFKAYASGSSMPDLVNVWGQPSFLNEVIDEDILAELNQDDYTDYNFLEGSLDGFSKDGKLYGLARNTDVMGFYYNKAIFEECGISIPTTYDEFLEAVAVLKEKDYIPVAFDGSDKWPMSIYINDLYQKISGKNTYDEVYEAVNSGDYSNEAWSQAIDLTMEAVDAGAFQSGFETTDYGTSMNLFSNGQAAMYYMGSWEMSMATNEDISEDIRSNIGAFAMPTVTGGSGSVTDVCAWNGGGYAVTESSAVKEEAIKLLNYMFEPENWSKLCWENGVCMSAQNFTDYLTGEETDLQNEWIEILNSATSISGVTFNDLGTNEFKTISEDASIELTIGSLDKDQFLSTLSDVIK
ncbi:MAG: ABC transporter substrate-binding protein [Lachnospiraceae bacterium]